MFTTACMADTRMVYMYNFFIVGLVRNCCVVDHQLQYWTHKCPHYRFIALNPIFSAKSQWDPGITKSLIPNPGIGKTGLRLQSLLVTVFCNYMPANTCFIVWYICAIQPIIWRWYSDHKTVSVFVTFGAGNGAGEISTCSVSSFLYQLTSHNGNSCCCETVACHGRQSAHEMIK